MAMGNLAILYRIFVFNPETIEVLKQCAYYQWSWVLLMLVALLVWNVKFWSFFRNESEKTSQSVLRAVAEGAAHWCLSNAALFGVIELHKAVYGHFTEYVPIPETVAAEQSSRIRKTVVGALTKIHLMNQRMTLMAHVKTPHVPLGIMLAATSLAIYLAFLVKKPEGQGQSARSVHSAANSEDVPSRFNWD